MNWFATLEPLLGKPSSPRTISSFQKASPEGFTNLIEAPPKLLLCRTAFATYPPAFENCLTQEVIQTENALAFSTKSVL